MNAAPITRSHGNATLTGPQGTWLTMSIAGEDGDPADLTEMSAQLLSIGSSHSGELDDNSGAGEGVEFASLECDDDVRFSIDGHDIDTSTALDLIAVGIRVALEEALKANPTDQHA